MTHTLHRQGTLENLAHDFPMHCMPAAGFNKEGSTPKLQEFLRLAYKHNPVNTGDSKVGNGIDLTMDDLLPGLTSTTHAVYTNKEDLAGLLKDLKQAELGMSVTLSGLLDSLFECCKKADIHPFAVEHSLKVLGDTSKLPDREIMQLTTMCGHALVSRGQIGILVDKMKKGEISAEEAGRELARPCQCGVFNPVRAAELLEEFCALYSISRC